MFSHNPFRLFLEELGVGWGGVGGVGVGGVGVAMLRKSYYKSVVNKCFFSAEVACSLPELRCGSLRMTPGPKIE